LVKLGQFQNSLKWLKRAVELDPAHSEAHYQLGQALRQLGREEEANSELETFRAIKARETPARARQPRR
jgi:Flp pilus assembly protein TadD